LCGIESHYSQEKDEGQFQNDLNLEQSGGGQDEK